MITQKVFYRNYVEITLQKVSTQFELPNWRNHVCRNIAYFADSTVFRGHNVQKVNNVYFISLCCIFDIMMANRKFDTRFRTLTYLLIKSSR